MMEHQDNTFESALYVKDGIPQPSIVNPYLKQHPLKKAAVLGKQDYVDGILSHNRVILSKAITLIESNLPSHYELAQSIISDCMPYAGKSIRIGITGMPGAGKSTFIESFGTYITGLGHQLAVLAIDPSSELSKGSILGDKTRMETLSVNPKAFIRPSPSAGSLGGVARKTRETIVLCEAAGFDTILVETVGVGQSETAVRSMVDFFLLVTIAGAGDELQGIKRGIMEMANAIVVNKADGENKQRSELAQRQLANSLQLFPNHNNEIWKTPVLTMSALEGLNIADVWDTILHYIQTLKEHNLFEEIRTRQSEECLKSFIDENLSLMFYENPAVKQHFNHIRQQLLQHQISAYAAGQQLLDLYLNSIKK